MAYVVRDPLFFAIPQPELSRHVKAIHYHPRNSYTKQLERRLVGLWKLLTKDGRKRPRDSYIARDFVTVTARRRSTFRPQYIR